MEFIKRIIIVVLVVLTPSLYLPGTIHAKQVQLNTDAEMTKHAPKSRTASEKDIPGKGGRSWWKWAIGVVVLGGVAAAVAGGSDGGGSDDDNDDDDGEATVEW